MKTQSFGRNGPELPVLGYGAMSVGNAWGPVDDAGAQALLASLVDMGITHVDTANVYGQGLSERRIGDFIRKNGNPFHIATKATISRAADGKAVFDNSPGYLFLDVLSRFYGPYDFNPLNLNPLRDILVETIDFDHARACRDIHLFISATNVRTGRVRVFHGHEVTADAVMASACLPFLYQAVEIDGEAYWDGGYMGNPSLFPLFKSKVGDILLVQINPIEREGTPKTAREILNRVMSSS